ncbi:MAG: hypothetical protein R2824_28760 [Saprospiraceae bacterium]|nr:hypothetical protein [Lewinella sp.]
MKTIMQALVLVLLCTLATARLQAQTELSMDSPVMDVNFTLDPVLQIDPKPATAQPVLIPQPLVLKHPKNGKCYAFRCAKPVGCENCGLYWKDRNGDGQINPKQELRCRCQGDPDTACKIRAREVACHE